MQKEQKPWIELPPVIESLKVQIESRIEGEVCFQLSDDPLIKGAMTIQWINGDLVIFCKRYSHGGAAEELLHGKLDLEGFKKPQLGEPNTIACQALTILHNLLQHAVVFPTLESWGFPQDEVECCAVSRQFGSLESQHLDATRIENEPDLLAFLTLLYVRAKRHCRGNEFTRLTKGLYKQPGYSDARNLAMKVIDEIDLSESSTPKQYNKTLQSCLDILGYGGKVKLVDARSSDVC